MARLAPPLAARVQSFALSDGIARIVLDVSGLSRSDRETVEQEVRRALADDPAVSEVRLAMTAERGTAAPAPASAPAAAPTQTAPAGPRILAVASGKGGVGKSTVSANLAVALARTGLRVGLVDADIHGPSQARLFGIEGEQPAAHDGKLVPVATRWGVPVLSMASLAPAGKAIAWRGPKVAGALTQLVEAHWDEADLLVLDLPPGTGDVQLTMLQQFRPAGAVIVSTPQDLALLDAQRAMAMFETTGVPIVGVVENMAGYACPHCGEVSDPFGAGGAEAAAREAGVPFLGRIPLDIAIRRESDAGTPVVSGNSPQAAAFLALGEAVAAWLGAADAAAGAAPR